MAYWLIDHGADINNQAYIDITPMSCFVRQAKPDFIENMLDRGGDVHKGELLQSALDRKTDIIRVLKMLLERGAPVNKLMYDGHEQSQGMFFFMEFETPLHTAAGRGNADIVMCLLENGADRTIRTSKGRTAIECAEEKGFTEVVDILENFFWD